MKVRLPIVVRLGGFHTLMSFLGSIGNVMRGSGLEDVFQLLCGENTIEHILMGKACARAIRGHFLVQAALVKLLISYLTGRASDDSSQPCVVLPSDLTERWASCIDPSVMLELEALAKVQT